MVVERVLPRTEVPAARNSQQKSRKSYGANGTTRPKQAYSRVIVRAKIMIAVVTGEMVGSD